MNNNKKILFVLPSFGIGGTTVSTRNLISVLEKSGFVTEVLCLTGEGVLADSYKNVKQIPADFIAHSLALQGWRDHNGHLSKLLVAALRYASNHNFKARKWLVERSVNRIFQNKEYDTVVACEEGFSTYYTSFVNCTNKVAWVRCDYKRYIEESGAKPDNSYYKYNSIVCVAQKPYDNFKQLYPDLKDRVYCINNPQDSQMIIEGSKINDNDRRFINKDFTIVSVGRFDKVKRFEYIPSIARILSDKELDFIWYVIGDGEPGRQEIESKINENDIASRVVLLGYKSNPHYYIGNADLLVCLSYSEACPRVINEAKVLGTPSVSTDFPTIYDFIVDSKDGLIRKIEDIPQAIESMIKDKTLYGSISEDLSKFQFDNSSIMKSLENIL